jgi:catechol 2,3-dioxygenase-like lactoylglutathione lyase family enzyme
MFDRPTQYCGSSAQAEDPPAALKSSVIVAGRYQTGFTMKYTMTIIGVTDVATSVKWYQRLFGQPETEPGHRYRGQICDSDGTVLLCVHQWGSLEYPSLMSPEQGIPGNGLLLLFRVDDFESALMRARGLVPQLDAEPRLNPATETQEFCLRDPDGYCVTVSALSAPQQSLGPDGRGPRKLPRFSRS